MLKGCLPSIPFVPKPPSLTVFNNTMNLEAWMPPWASNTSDVWRRRAFGPSQLRALKEYGIKGVRFCIEPSTHASSVGNDPSLYDAADYRSWYPTETNLILWADTIHALEEEGMSCIFEIAHIHGTHWSWSRIVDGTESRWFDMWAETAAWAKRQGFNTDLLAFETSGELGTIKKYDPALEYSQGIQVPQDEAWEQWKQKQNELITEIRKHLPNMWVFASDLKWQALDLCDNYDRVGDKLTAKAWHHYTPFVFTHQGMAWVNEGNTWWNGIGDLGRDHSQSVPYPMTETDLAALDKSAMGVSTKNSLSAPFSEADQEAIYRRASEWMVRNNQFGVITEAGTGNYGHPEHYLRWLSHNRELATKYDLPVSWFSLWATDWNRDKNTRGYGYFYRDYSTHRLEPIPEMLEAIAATP